MNINLLGTITLGGRVMKNIGLLLSSIAAFFIILGCLFYNLLLIDMDRIKDYVTESNSILQDVMENGDKVDKEKGDYISRLIKIKRNGKFKNIFFVWQI